VDRKPGLGAEVRLRTMKASADSELGMVSADDILHLCDTFPELEIRLQSFRKAGNKLSEKGHNAREIRELKRRALLRSASTQGSPSFRRSPSYRTPSHRNRSSSTASSTQDTIAASENGAAAGGAPAGGSSQRPPSSPLTAEEDARAERVANAAGSLLGLGDEPGGGSGNGAVAAPDDGRPERVQFEGLHNADDAHAEMIMPANDELQGEVPASVYLAVASVSPRATQEQLDAAEELLDACDGHEPVAMRRLMEAGDRRWRIRLGQ